MESPYISLHRKKRHTKFIKINMINHSLYAKMADFMAKSKELANAASKINIPDLTMAGV